jgi:hypothetical protein
MKKNSLFSGGDIWDQVVMETCFLYKYFPKGLIAGVTILATIISFPLH